jgi:nucleoside-diphosphate-sugar epimerase
MTISSSNNKYRTKILVVGSGAGGAITAHTLAQNGFEVLVLEEGKRHTLADYGARPSEAMGKLYRNAGMNPIQGSVPIGFAEGQCLGGSTEINSGFWHRLPPEFLLRWQARFNVQDISSASLDEHFTYLEEMLTVAPYPGQWPPSTQVFARGIEAMQWSYQEVPRTASSCRSNNSCASGCPSGAKQGMTNRFIPEAEAMGVRFLTDCKAKLILHHQGKATGVLAQLTRQEKGVEELVRIDADYVFICAGPTQTPALLRRSGIKQHIGNSLRIHPMLKVSALFNETLDAHKTVLPLLQVKEFWPDISLGGSFFSPGHLALNLQDNWLENQNVMKDYRQMASFYVAVRGTGAGTVRTSSFNSDETKLSYELSHADIINLSQGLGRMAMLLLAAGARAVYPCVYGKSKITSELEAVSFLDEPLPARALSLTTVHAFSTCPMGENSQRCAVNSFGLVAGFKNLYLNDASILPDSPGINPQATIMALARRNALNFVENYRKHNQGENQATTTDTKDLPADTKNSQNETKDSSINTNHPATDKVETATNTNHPAPDIKDSISKTNSTATNVGNTEATAISETTTAGGDTTHCPPASPTASPIAPHITISTATEVSPQMPDQNEIEQEKNRREHREQQTAASFPSSEVTQASKGIQLLPPPATPAIITGAPGWLGTRLARALALGLENDLLPPAIPELGEVNQNRTLKVLATAGSNIGELKTFRENLQAVMGDLATGEGLDRLFEKSEGATVFHAAGVIHPTSSCAQLYAVNVEGTRRMLEAAVKAGVKRFIYVSSNSPLGCNKQRGTLFDENSPYNPYMHYGKSKKWAEELVKEYGQTSQLETVIIRPPWFYGPNQPPRQSLFFSMIRQGKVPIVGDGGNLRSMAYVDNICQGLLLCERVAQARNNTYWIADERPYAMNEIVDTIENLLEKEFNLPCQHKRLRLPGLVSEIALLADAGLQSVSLYQQKIHVLSEMNKNIACSIEKARRDLGYNPRISLEEGMRRSIKWILEKGAKI